MSRGGLQIWPSSPNQLALGLPSPFDHGGRRYGLCSRHCKRRSLKLNLFRSSLNYADPHVRDNEGRGPLHVASEIGEEQTLRYLRYSIPFEPPARKTNRNSYVAKPAYRSHPGNLIVEDPLRPLQAHTTGMGYGTRDRNYETLDSKPYSRYR